MIYVLIYVYSFFWADWQAPAVDSLKTHNSNVKDELEEGGLVFLCPPLRLQLSVSPIRH